MNIIKKWRRLQFRTTHTTGQECGTRIFVAYSRSSTGHMWGGGFRPQPIDKCHHNAMRSENIMSFVYDLAVTGRDSRRRRIHDYKFFAVTTDLFL